ncbi:MAG: ABC transporter permease [Spirochaetia bacterium]
MSAVSSLKSNLRVVKASMGLTLKQNMIDAFIIFTILIQPLIVAILGIWMLQGKGPEYAIFVVVGSGMSGLWSSLLYISGNSINVERWFGTLETLTGVPTSLQVITLGKNLAHVIQSLFSMLGCYILASFIFGYPLSIQMPLLFFVSLVFTVIAFVAFGLIISPLFILNPMIQRWQNGLEFPVFIISGFLFPIAMLPIWTRPISWIFPTYWAAKALHITAEAQGTLTEVITCWGILLFSAAVYGFLSHWFFKTMVRKAKVDATLDAH